MAPILRPRQSVSKDRFPAYFGPLKSQTYHDTSNPTRTSGAYSLRSIAWNPLGTLVATGASDKILRVWNPEKPNVRFSTELKGHSSAVEKVAFNPVKDAELCSVGEDGTVKIWDVRTKACVNEVKGADGVHSLVWAPDGQSLIVADRSANIYTLSPTQSTPLSCHQQPTKVNQMAICWSGNKVFVPTVEGKIRILSYPDFEPVFHLNYAAPGRDSDEFLLKGHTSSCLTAELSPTGKYLATGGADSIIALWDTTDWLCQRTVTRLPGPVRSISFTFDGSYVVGGCEEGPGLDVTHTETGEHVHSFKTAGPCEVVAWAPTRYCLAYGDVGMLRIIGIDTERK